MYTVRANTYNDLGRYLARPLKDLHGIYVGMESYYSLTMMNNREGYVSARTDENVNYVHYTERYLGENIIDIPLVKDVDAVSMMLFTGLERLWRI